MRILRALINFILLLIAAATVAVVLGLYLAFSGKSVPFLRTLAANIGRSMEGQRTARLELAVRVEPATSHLDGTALLDVQSTAAQRPRLYFLLNDGLKVVRMWQEEPAGQTSLEFYRIGPLVVVQLPRALAKDESARIGIDYEGNPLQSRLGERGVLNPDQVLLKVDALWFPMDLQSFFLADVTVTLPAHLTLLHNGHEEGRQRIGTSTRVRWTTPRAVPGLALVAGLYRDSVKQTDTGSYRVALSTTIGLDPTQLQSAAAASDALFTQRYGPSGFPSITIFVDPNVGRAFNDGSALIGLAPRYFRSGDYGFSNIAHEVAHNWWGSTVAEKWLQPGTGGEWIVEGFAEFSSFVAVREQFGEAGLLRQLEAAGYDPTQSRVLADMSVLDNGFDPKARSTIYQKGAWVTLMLQHLVGEETFFTAARQFIERFRLQQATDADVQATFAEVSKQDLGPFFDTWVRSDALFDLALDPQESGAIAQNHGTALAPPTIALWRFAETGEPERQTLALNATTTLAGAQRLVLDPVAATADMYRGNNVFPQRPNPRAVATSSRGELMVVYGEPYRWSPATVTSMDANGRPQQSWEFDRGVQLEPMWGAAGVRILAAETDRNDVTRLVALNSSDGSRTIIGRGEAGTATAQATVVVRGDRLIALQGGKEVTLVQHPGRQLSAPLVSPDESHIAYGVSDESATDLRVAATDGSGDRLLFTWRRTDIKWQWDPAGTNLFVVLPGEWDWQLWEIPLGSGAPRALAREAAAMGAPAVAADGNRIAFIAAATLDYGRERRNVFVVDRQTGIAQRHELNGATAHSVAWLNADELLVIVSDPSIAALPRLRELHRLRLPDGALVAFP